MLCHMPLLLLFIKVSRASTTDHDAGEPQGARWPLGAHAEGADARRADGQLRGRAVRRRRRNDRGGERRHPAEHVRSVQGGARGR